MATPPFEVEIHVVVLSSDRRKHAVLCRARPRVTTVLAAPYVACRPHRKRDRTPVRDDVFADHVLEMQTLYAHPGTRTLRHADHDAARRVFVAREKTVIDVDTIRIVLQSARGATAQSE